MPTVLLAYWSYRDELSAQNGVLFKGQRVIIPEKMRSEMLRKVHDAHLGQEACLRRARETLFWPGMTAAVKDLVSPCDACNTFRPVQEREILQTWKFQVGRGAL